jgi:hypothetical protein
MRRPGSGAGRLASTGTKEAMLTRLRCRRPALVIAVAAAAAVALGLQSSARPAPAVDPCGLPDSRPLWIDYGAGTVPREVRAILARPGVVVAATGTAIPNNYRAAGAATAYFQNLPPLVGQPAQPADPAALQGRADALFDRAVASTRCSTPIVALNELLGSHLPAPWSATNAQYRANILALVERLAQRGARPSLFVHGNPNVAGAAAAWWAAVGRSAEIAYEAYYNAANISRLGPLLGNRRMRLGMRSIVRLFSGVGVPRSRIGLVLGFQVAPGASGREGLQPREEWLRVVKWEALAARQVAAEEAVGTIWSWGWGTFGPQSVDPDKPAAACVYLWTRDAALCDGPAAAGAAFDVSRQEGQIVLPEGVRCTFAGGSVRRLPVSELALLTGDMETALTAVFARSVLRAAAPVGSDEILGAERAAVERAFGGSRAAYVRELEGRWASVPVARDVIADELRRQKLAAQLSASGSGQTTLAWTADLEAAAADTATCAGDFLPGSGDFPRSDKREIGVVPLPAYLPFLFADRTPPAAPAAPVTTAAEGRVVLDWADGAEPDLAGYEVARSATPGGPYEAITRTPLTRSVFEESAPPAGTAAVYVVRAVDSSGNLSAPSAEVAAPQG